MTERYSEQMPNSQPIWPLSPEEVALARQEREQLRFNAELARRRRAEGLAEIERMLGMAEDPQGANPLESIAASGYPQSFPQQHDNTSSQEGAPKVIGRSLTVDGLPVHMSSRVSDELRRQYVEGKQENGSSVEFELIDPKDDATAFRTEDQAKLAAALAADGKDTVKSPRNKTLHERIGIEDGDESFPLRKRRLDFVKNKKAMRIGAVALVAMSLAGGATFVAQPGNVSDHTAADVAGPGVANASVEKRIDAGALLSDCTPDKIGATIASGTMSVNAGVIWNIPNGTDVFPKLSLGAWDHDGDPATAPTNEPRYLPVTANNMNVSLAVCDTAGASAVSIQSDVVHVNLANVSPQIAFAANAESAPELSALKQEDLNKLVAKEWMTQESADALRKNMVDPKLAVDATKEALYGVVEQMKQNDNKTGLAVVAALKAQLPAAVAKELPVKADGTPYEIVLEGELANERIQGVGVDAVKNEAFTVEAPRIIAEKINPPASEGK
ncbi:MAG TPA: hypothetical protein VGO98_00025 [Candidatus Saccharimonadales bacterium]|jgi:hypothetical protein|nr:hypothetical protein [Candidatus Saccharimonadales bacterium]